MELKTLEEVGAALVEVFYSERILPGEVIHKFAQILASEDQDTRMLFLNLWSQANKKRQTRGQYTLDLQQPLILSRGYDSLIAEEELVHYLPEEKILINKDLFRGKLDSIDFSTLDSNRERVLLDSLEKESLGLRREDVILYFNLIKINQLAGKSKNPEAALSVAREISITGVLLWQQAEKAFGFTNETIAKVNGGKVMDPKILREILQGEIANRRIQPKVFLNFLGWKNDKYIGYFKEFIRITAVNRGEEASELTTQGALYLILNGTKLEVLEKLNLASPLLTFITDKIGRIRTIYYASIVFIQSFLYVLFAQVYEISTKYFDSDQEQKQKLLKLYSAEDRMSMLIANATNMASRKLAPFKVEAREVLTNFKKFTASKKDLITGQDLFGIDYRPLEGSSS